MDHAPEHVVTVKVEEGHISIGDNEVKETLKEGLLDKVLDKIAEVKNSPSKVEEAKEEVHVEEHHKVTEEVIVVVDKQGHVEEVVKVELDVAPDGSTEVRELGKIVIVDSMPH